MKAINIILATALAIAVLGPLSMMVTVSLNPSEEQILVTLGTLKAFIPHVVSFENYREILADPSQPFPRFLFNTLFIVVVTVGLSIVVNSSAAFALAWGRGGYRKYFLAMIIAIFVIPMESIVMPLLLIVSRLGWVDSYHVQIIPFIAHPFSIFLFYQFFSRLPHELIEAARLDGASFFQIFFRIALPLCTPVMATVAILQFLEFWNSYLWPAMVTRGTEYRPLAVAMAAYFSSRQAFWGNIMAFAVLMSVPVMVVFLIFQKWFVRSLVGSSVKG